MQLFDAEGQPVFPATRLASNSLYTNMICPSVTLSQPVSLRRKKWSHETPYLYTLVVALRDAQGQAVQYLFAPALASARSRSSNRELLVNGKAVLIKGVNRHEHDEKRGKALTMEVDAGRYPA